METEQMEEFMQRMLLEPDKIWNEWVGISPEELRKISIERGSGPYPVIIHYAGDSKSDYDLSQEQEIYFSENGMAFIDDNILIDFLYAYLEDSLVAEIDDDDGIWTT